MEWIQPTSSTMLSLLIGLGLSASCGFRIFVPPFIISLAMLSVTLTKHYIRCAPPLRLRAKRGM